MPNPPLFLILLFLLVIGVTLLVAIVIALAKIWGWFDNRKRRNLIDFDEDERLWNGVTVEYVDEPVKPRTVGDILDTIEWWPKSRLGDRSHRPHDPPFDQRAERPPALVGGGRGHAIS